ncbi:GtrA family protein [Paenibacillus sp. J22TS3]|uniref:GtrA family protein n=1 Tax=Paenibacillus sp. J22TS3 TaxID=2807192 RepID=UPI001B213AFB|nr:GtrA family protein [Paenibacillus sp. J22TS3]GIP22630.1 GtrA-like protein [Paenibacillus sp. J22TS3]
MKSYAARESLRAIVIFGLVGLVNTGVDVAVFTLLTWCHLPWLVAQVAAYGCGVMNSFLMNRKWTFKQQKTSSKELIRFIILNLLTLGVTSVCMLLVHEQIGAPLWISKGVSTLVGLVFNFAGSRWWVFQAKPSREEAASL